MKSNSRVVAPRLVAEAAVLGRRRSHRLGRAAKEPLRRALPQPQIVVPQRHLRLDQPRRVGHQPRGHLEKSRADRHRVGHADAVPAVLTSQEIGDEPLASLGDVGPLPRQLGRVRSRVRRCFRPASRGCRCAPAPLSLSFMVGSLGAAATGRSNVVTPAARSNTQRLDCAARPADARQIAAVAAKRVGRADGVAQQPTPTR